MILLLLVKHALLFRSEHSNFGGVPCKICLSLKNIWRILMPYICLSIKGITKIERMFGYGFVGALILAMPSTLGFTSKMNF
jgi:hypothetical protein